MSKTVKKHKSNEKRISYPSFINYIVIALVAIINILFFTSLNDVNQFSGFSETIFVILNVVVLAILVCVNLFVAFAIKLRTQKILITMMGLLVVMGLSGGYLSYVTTTVSSNIDKIVVQGEQEEEIEVSFVVYDENGSFTLETLDDLTGKTVAVSSNHADEQGYILPVAELTANNITVTLAEYDSNMDQLNALFAKEVDAVALPSNYVELYGDEGILSARLENTKAVHTFSEIIKTTVETSGTGIDVTSEPFTVLLIGVDEGRSDALMVVSVNPVSLRVTVTSVPRDSYVPIACYAGNASDKINHARSRGRQCTIDTVEDLLDIEIDFFAETNFKGVVNVVDSLGGIVVDNPFEFVGQDSSSERGHKTVWVPAGDDVLLNGEQALAFARERKLYLTGDFQRQANQQQVIEGILNRIVNMDDVNQALAVLNAAGENVSTNMSVDQLIDFFNLLMAKMSRTSVQEEMAIDLVQTSITGYNSSVWSEAGQYSMSIVRLWEGAIADAHDLIMENLEYDRVIDSEKTMKFSINWLYNPPVTVLDSYPEAQIVSTAPPLVADFYGMDIADVQAWCIENGIGLTIEEADYDSQYYVETLAENAVSNQSVLAGTVLSTIDHINVHIVKHPEQSDSVEVPSFTGKTVEDFQEYLEENDLEEGDMTTAYSNEVAVGLIISNDLSAAGPDFKVNYVVSLGPQPSTSSSSLNSTSTSSQNSSVATSATTTTSSNSTSTSTTTTTTTTTTSTTKAPETTKAAPVTTAPATEQAAPETTAPSE